MVIKTTKSVFIQACAIQRDHPSFHICERTNQPHKSILTIVSIT